MKIQHVYSTNTKGLATNKLGKNARKNVLKNFEVNKVNDRTLKVYSELIHSKNKK